MQPRLDFAKAAPAAYQAMLAFSNHARQSGLEPSLQELIKIRASQINRCAYCLDMHTKDARAQGETEQRIYALSAWREAPFFSERERAALAWTEALTCIAQEEVSDALYETCRRQFGEQELVNLSLAVIAINGWNRLCGPFRSVAGSYQPSAKQVG